MQAVKYLELRIPAECMDEAAFQQLAESLQTLGTAMETEVDIILDPGMAFGTGTHPTTQLDDVAAAYIAEGLTEIRRDTQNEWASIELKLLNQHCSKMHG